MSSDGPILKQSTRSHFRTLSSFPSTPDVHSTHLRAASMPRVAAVDFPTRSTHDRLHKVVQRHDAHRAMGFWHSALSATRGLFSPPPRVGEVDAIQANSTLPPVEARRKQLRKATSTPSLKVGQSVHNIPALPAFLANSSSNASPRKPTLSGPGSTGLKSASKLKISSPSPPKPLTDFTSVHPKFVYPISPIPSPVGSCFPPSAKAPPHSASNLLINSTIPEDISCSNEEGSSPVRRRTKSAPGVKITKRALSSYFPSISSEQGSEGSEISTPVIIDIMTPSVASPSSSFLPSPPLESPRVFSDYFPQCPNASPNTQLASPRSFTSVKRKPVPRHLYSESLDNSVPCTPLLTPIPGTPVEVEVTGTSKNGILNSLNTPLLPPSEVIIKSCTRNKNGSHDVLPIGEGRAIKARHRRSVSANGYGNLLGPHSTSQFLTPWYKSTSRILTPLSIPTANEVAECSEGLPAPPRASPAPDTPPCVGEGISALPDNTSVRSSFERSGAMSPLTDDEINAIRSFLRRHATGTKARQRRRARSNQAKVHDRQLSVQSRSYDMHAQIYNSYLDEDEEFYSAASSEEDLENHHPMSISDGHDSSTSLLQRNRNAGVGGCDVMIADVDAGTEVYHDEIETPIVISNRGTFGYYNIPMIRRSSSGLGTDGLAVCIPNDGCKDAHLEIPQEWLAGADMDVNEEDIHKDDKASAYDGENEHEFQDGPCLAVSTRTSSLSEGSSADHTPRLGDENPSSNGSQRTSCEPLIPRMLNSDSESDRPISSSSASTSFMSSSSSGFSSQAGIGLAIMPPEQYANFDKYESMFVRDSSCSPSDCSEDDSPRTIPCHTKGEQFQKDVEYVMNNLSIRFGQLQEDLSNLQLDQDRDGADSVRGSELGNLQSCVRVDMRSPVLKPALQIRPVPANRFNTMCQLPSPTETTITYPPQTFGGSDEEQKGASTSVDEATPFRKGSWVQSLNDSSEAEGDSEDMGFGVKSFMHLTPNESGDEGNDSKSKKRSRVKLRQLFSKAALRTTSGKKCPAGGK